MKRTVVTLSILVASVPACTWLADRELEEFEASTSTAGVQSAAATSGSGGNSTSATTVASTATAGGAPDQCGMSPVPAPQECPEECTGGCDGDVCRIECDEDQECKELTIVCPAGWPCEVECAGHQSCERTILHCPADFTCIHRCIGSASCVNGDVFVQNGVFEVSCSSQTDSCKDLQVNCGGNACRAQCLGSAKPDLNCGPACECAPCM